MIKENNFQIVVSVIVPIFNTERDHLEACLLPFQKEKDSRIEVILVDDGSNESTAQLIDSIAERLQVYTRVVHQANGGQNAARNTGIRLAHGKYIAFVDSDDELNWQSFMTLVDQAETCDADVIAFSCMKLRPNGDIISKYGFSDIDENEQNKKNLLARCGELWLQWIKRSYLLDSPPFPTDLRIGEDLEAVFPLLANVRSFAVNPSYVYFYIDRQVSVSKNSSSLEHLDIIKAFQRIIDNPRSHFGSYRNELEWQAIRHVAWEIMSVLMMGQCGFDAARRLRDWFVSVFPNWERNAYYQELSVQDRLITFLIFHGYFKIYLFLRKVSSLLKKNNSNKG